MRIAEVMLLDLDQQGIIIQWLYMMNQSFRFAPYKHLGVLFGSSAIKAQVEFVLLFTADTVFLRLGKDLRIILLSDRLYSQV